MPSGDVKKTLAQLPYLRVLARVVDDNGCWLWSGATNGPQSHLYGVVMTGSRSDGTRRLRPTHVVVFEELIGPVPEGMELDHLCRRTLCCNPIHLEPVTHAENMRRAFYSPQERRRRSEHMRAVSARRWRRAA